MMDLLSDQTKVRTFGLFMSCFWFFAFCGSVTTAISMEAEPVEEILIPVKTPKGVIYAELADTPLKRGRGLMFRDHLPADRGMLFTFGDLQAWSFWMKNTKIPLDIVWMDDKKKIVHIERNLPICTKTDDSCPQYRSNDGAMFVLELAGGRADALDLQRGKRLDFKLP
ncbi:MAG TPA: DUF192 domain-containing protein [Nitrospiraceae bacterium]|nr:DUF192 domain-containing protein [Nitrospiraceae bacterium]